MRLDPQTTVEWIVVTRFHDWLGQPMAADFLAALETAGVAGAPEWIELGLDAARRAFPPLPAERRHEFLMTCRDPDDRSRQRFRLGGERPAPWTASCHVRAWDDDGGRVDGYSVLGARFPLSAASPSASLADAFSRLHKSENTEYASIHGSSEAARLRMHDYRDAVTYAPMFAGVYWANFLGRGHIELFETGKLQDLDAARLELSGDRCLLIVSPELAESLEPAGQGRLLSLTERFRSARREQANA
ncbi:MAG: hypothetical protein IT162_19165 [Bryobacterales bacterium]|nr:hypothetical protein [Bryobacterales bacterium]